jgi:small subunit ribosomal protein S29
MTIAATSSKCGRTTALDLALRHVDVGPFEKIDPRVAESTEGAEVIVVGKLSKREAKSLMDYYNQSGILKDPVSIDTFNEKYALSSGNPRDLFVSCLRVRA